MIELYDVGRVLIKPFTDGYKFIAEHGEKYISDTKALEEIITFHRDRTKKISQWAFNYLNDAWVKAIEDGKLECDPDKLVYDDVIPRFEKVKANGDQVYLLTSGSKKLTKFLLGDKVKYDGIFVAEEWGDKNNPKTYKKIQKEMEYEIGTFFDDKVPAIQAALDGMTGYCKMWIPKLKDVWQMTSYPQLYLMDRRDKVPKDMVKSLVKGNRGKVFKINSFDDALEKYLSDCHDNYIDSWKRGGVPFSEFDEDF